MSQKGKELVLSCRPAKRRKKESRVKIIIGVNNAMVIAPHGCDDNRTDIIATSIAQALDCSAVINVGWQRDCKYNSNGSKGNMNRLDHVFIGSARREFLYPILTIKNILVEHYDTLFVFLIHGMFDAAQKRVKGLECVLGYGASFPWWNDSLTIDLWRKSLLSKLLNDGGLLTYDGKGGGTLSGRRYSNINQLFRNRNSPFFDDRVQSIQLEIVYGGHRDNPRNAVHTGRFLAGRFRALMETKEKPGEPEPAEYKLY